MIFPYLTGAYRPNRITDTRNDKYYTDYARWCLSQSCNSKLWYNIYKYYVNLNFFRGNQWLFNEDLELFLEDESGEWTQRLKWCFNIIGPLVRTYHNTALKIDFSVRAYNSSPFALSRRESEVGMRMKAHDFADGMPRLKNRFQQEFRLGKNPQETEENFRDEDEDYTELAINNTLRKIEQRNRFNLLQDMSALNLALGGIGIIKETTRNGDIHTESIEPPFFGYDTGALMPDLSDAHFMFDMRMALPTEIFERAPDLERMYMKLLEETARKNTGYDSVMQGFFMSNSYSTAGRIPLYCVYWKDLDKQDWGYVDDEDNVIPVRIDGETYTKNDVLRKDSDLLSKKQKSMINKDGIIRRNKEIISYCEFVPKEMVGSDVDIVLESGSLPYIEAYDDAPFETKFPYKIATTGYKDGEMITVCDDHISPQRFINRLVSTQESILNNGGGIGLIADKHIMVGEEDAEATFKSDIKRGKTALVDSKKYGGNVQNAIRDYDATGIKGALGFNTIIEGIRNMTNISSGVNDFMTGVADGRKVLKSVHETLLNRGQLLQEHFFHAMELQWESIYRCIANKALKLYSEHERQFTMPTEHHGLVGWQFYDDMKYESVDISLRRVSTEQIVIEANNQLLMQLLEIGVIDSDGFAALYNRAETDQVSYAIRDFNRKKKKANAAMQEHAEQDKQEQDQKQQLALNMALAQDNRNKAFEADQNERDRGAHDKQQQRTAITKLMLENMKMKHEKESEKSKSPKVRK